MKMATTAGKIEQLLSQGGDFVSLEEHKLLEHQLTLKQEELDELTKQFRKLDKKLEIEQNDKEQLGAENTQLEKDL